MRESVLRGVWRVALIGIVLGLSPGVGAEEVPYVQSSMTVVDTMLSIAEVGPQDFVVDLGSGDGRIVIGAAKRFGARALGIEYDSTLVGESRSNAVREGVADRASFLRQDIFEADFSDATVVTMYLLPEVNLQLRPRILYGLRPGTRVVSHDFDMGDWEPDAKRTVPVPDKPVGPRKESTIFLWTVPARLAGPWRGTLTGPLGEEPVLLEFAQRFQKVQATIWLPRSDMGGTGRIQGSSIRLDLRRSQFGTSALQFTLKAVDGRLEGEAFEEGKRYLLKAARIPS